jgi:hypothetical protein
MTQEDDVTGDQDARRPLDPVVAGLLDGANAGYQAVESVLQGLNEGLRRQAARPPARSGAPAPRGFAPRPDAAPAPGGPRDLAPGAPAGRRGELAGHLLGIVDGLLGVATNMTQSLADLNARRAAPPAAAPAPATDAPLQVAMTATPGTDAIGDFALWNTGPSILTDVSFSATELMGGPPPIRAAAVSFAPPYVPQIAPGASALIGVVVGVPADAPPGRYHGLIQPSVGAAWAVVELEVAEASPA